MKIATITLSNTLFRPIRYYSDSLFALSFISKVMKLWKYIDKIVLFSNKHITNQLDKDIIPI